MVIKHGKPSLVHMVVLWRCQNRYHHLHRGSWARCANLTLRPGLCRECREPDPHPFTYPETKKP